MSNSEGLIAWEALDVPIINDSFFPEDSFKYASPPFPFITNKDEKCNEKMNIENRNILNKNLFIFKIENKWTGWSHSLQNRTQTKLLLHIINNLNYFSWEIKIGICLCLLSATRLL